MSDTFSSELLREMENDLSQSEDDAVDETSVTNVDFTIVPGLRQGSEIMWVADEEHLYYKNSVSDKTKIAAYTCRVSSCTARVFVNPDGSAHRRIDTRHIISHGSQFEDFKKMHADNKMKDKAISAPASMNPYDTYMEVVKE